MTPLFKVLIYIALQAVVSAQNSTNTTVPTSQAALTEVVPVTSYNTTVAEAIQQVTGASLENQTLPIQKTEVLTTLETLASSSTSTVTLTEPSVASSTETITSPTLVTANNVSESVAVETSEIPEAAAPRILQSNSSTSSPVIVITLNRSISQGPVIIDVYYESLCPDSKKLLTKQVWPTIQKLRNETLKDLISFRFWPYGKSNETYNNETGRWEFQCHHGPNECLGNLWHTCALYGNMTTRGDAEFFISCTYGYSNLSEGLSKCSEAGKFSYPEMQACASSAQANTLMRNSGLKTKALVPPLTYIPTVTINQQYDKATSSRAEAEFENLACDLVAAQLQMCNRI